MTTKIDTSSIDFEGDIEIERLVFAKNYVNQFMFNWKLGRKTWRGYDKAESRAYNAALAAFDAAFEEYLKAKYARRNPVKRYTQREVDRFAKNLATLREENENATEHYRTQLDYLDGRGADREEYRFAVKAEAAAYRKAESARQRIEKQTGGDRKVFRELLLLSGEPSITSDEASHYGGVFRG